MNEIKYYHKDRPGKMRVTKFLLFCSYYEKSFDPIKKWFDTKEEATAYQDKMVDDFFEYFFEIKKIGEHERCFIKDAVNDCGCEICSIVSCSLKYINTTRWRDGVDGFKIDDARGELRYRIPIYERSYYIE